MAAAMSWRDAIVKVLEENGAPMHYAEISQAILDKGYKKNAGATPPNSVAATLSLSIANEKNSPFQKVGRGIFTLHESGVRTKVRKPSTESEEGKQETGLINAFGMFWRKDNVQWVSSMPALLGMQQGATKQVNFTDQAGVYVLYDRDKPIYVGKAGDGRLGRRLFDHTRDRLSGRWDRFSWFGVRAVHADGKLDPLPASGIALETLIATMEALLIEGLEPPQNRRQGDGFNAVEFNQVKDPAIEVEQRKSLIAELLKGAGLS